MNEKYHMILTVRLPVDIASWLQAQANDRGVAVQDVIREKLDESKRREEKEATKDLQAGQAV